LLALSAMLNLRRILFSELVSGRDDFISSRTLIVVWAFVFDLRRLSLRAGVSQ